MSLLKRLSRFLPDLKNMRVDCKEIEINGTLVTSTAAELNITDGVTATAAEINKLAGVTAGTALASKAAVLGANQNLDVLAIADLKLGAGAGTSVTSTAAELNILDGVTANYTQLNQAPKKEVVIPLGAVNTTTSYTTFVAPCAGTITAFNLANKDAIALDTTNYWEAKLTNKGTTGTAAVTVAIKDTKTATGTAFAAYAPWPVTITGTATMAVGELLLLTLTKGGTAQATAEAMAQIEFTPS